MSNINIVGVLVRIIKLPQPGSEVLSDGLTLTDESQPLIIPEATNTLQNRQLIFDHTLYFVITCRDRLGYDLVIINPLSRRRSITLYQLIFIILIDRHYQFPVL